MISIKLLQLLSRRHTPCWVGNNCHRASCSHTSLTESDSLCIEDLCWWEDWKTIHSATMWGLCYMVTFPDLQTETSALFDSSAYSVSDIYRQLKDINNMINFTGYIGDGNLVSGGTLYNSITPIFKTSIPPIQRWNSQVKTSTLLSNSPKGDNNHSTCSRWCIF